MKEAWILLQKIEGPKILQFIIFKILERECSECCTECSVNNSTINKMCTRKKVILSAKWEHRKFNSKQKLTAKRQSWSNSKLHKITRVRISKRKTLEKFSVVSVKPAHTGSWPIENFLSSVEPPPCIFCRFNDYFLMFHSCVCAHIGRYASAAGTVIVAALQPLKWPQALYTGLFTYRHPILKLSVSSTLVYCTFDHLSVLPYLTPFPLVSQLSLSLSAWLCVDSDYYFILLLMYFFLSG